MVGYCARCGLANFCPGWSLLSHWEHLYDDLMRYIRNIKMTWISTLIARLPISVLASIRSLQFAPLRGITKILSVLGFNQLSIQASHYITTYDATIIHFLEIPAEYI